MGKGSSPRPFSVSQETFSNNYDAIFKKKPALTFKDLEEDLDERARLAELEEIRSKGMKEFLNNDNVFKDGK
jgi:hypothetical protein